MFYTYYFTITSFIGSKFKEAAANIIESETANSVNPSTSTDAPNLETDSPSNPNGDLETNTGKNRDYKPYIYGALVILGLLTLVGVGYYFYSGQIDPRGGGKTMPGGLEDVASGPASPVNPAPSRIAQEIEKAKASVDRIPNMFRALMGNNPIEPLEPVSPVGSDITVRGSDFPPTRGTVESLMAVADRQQELIRDLVARVEHSGEDVKVRDLIIEQLRDARGTLKTLPASNPSIAIQTLPAVSTMGVGVQVDPTVNLANKEVQTVTTWGAFSPTGPSDSTSPTIPSELSPVMPSDSTSQRVYPYATSATSGATVSGWVGLIYLE